ncbi:hypothetical protein GGR55DRAFT_639138 [Xylaria sp. FL0064]|nr:hypothetical protein GGR55DRAFT_639138 [Xylaria sp. FL0064]
MESYFPHYRPCITTTLYICKYEPIFGILTRSRTSQRSQCKTVVLSTLHRCSRCPWLFVSLTDVESLPSLSRSSFLPAFYAIYNTSIIERAQDCRDYLGRYSVVGGTYTRTYRRNKGVSAPR